MSTPPGPYMNEDGDWWVPVDAMSFREARALVRQHAEAPRLAYVGKTMAWLDSEHEGWCEEDCDSNRHVLAYHFEDRGWA